MDKARKQLTDEDLAAQKPELLPDREAMSVISPLPPQDGDTVLFPADPTHPLPRVPVEEV